MVLATASHTAASIAPREILPDRQTCRQSSRPANRHRHAKKLAGGVNTHRRTFVTSGDSLLISEGRRASIKLNATRKAARRPPVARTAFVRSTTHFRNHDQPNAEDKDLLHFALTSA